MMLEIQCPRCHQFWYAEEEIGNACLCSQCVDQLRSEAKSTRRRKSRSRYGVRERRSPGVFFYYTLTIGILVPLLMLLSSIWPTVFGPVLITIGLLLLIGGLILLRRVLTELSRFDQVGEWWGGHYFAVAAIAGICCVVFFFKTVKPRMSAIAAEKRQVDVPRK